MNHFILKQLRFARENTVDRVLDINDESSHYIPKGFHNNIKWNLGHIYFVQEKFAFYFIGEELQLPNHFEKWFSPGTSPADWHNQELPSIRDFILLLEKQTDRLEQLLPLKMDVKLDQPYTTSTGLTLSTVEELLSFCFYHEGMHFDAIKSIKRMIPSKIQ
jgi:uncharacterized damage-inducible protein DinB